MTKKFPKNQKDIKENEKGITLITLVITIAIILILGGTTINMVAGEAGVFRKSKETQDLQINHVNSEDTQTNILINNVNEELKEDWQDVSGANPPKLSAEMVPVKWDGENWVVTNKKDSEWFDYTEKKWANIMLRDGLVVEGIDDATTASVEAMQGKIVTEVGSMFVWIPRYGYQITDGYHLSGAQLNSGNPELGAGTINIEFLKGTSDIGVNGKTTWDNRSGQGNWNVHPAFDYNGAVEGIWVAKFEASNVEGNGNSADTDDVTTKTLQVKPGVSSWRYITVGNMYTVCLEYDTNVLKNGNLNSHMMKNSEWGAVAYLTQSTYGKNSKVWINNSSSHITGSAGNSATAATNEGTTNDYTSSQGVEASTTGNIYGIYDMSGGTWERTAAYVNNGNENLGNYASSLILGASYTKDVYEIGTDSSTSTSDTRVLNYEANAGIYGDAVYETSSGTYDDLNDEKKTQSWYKDGSYFVYSSNPLFSRGGNYSQNFEAGLFRFSPSNGKVGNGDTFRPVFIIK